MIKTIDFRTVDGIIIDILIGTQKLENIQENVNLGSHFEELKRGEETVKVGLRPKKNVFNNEDESGKDEEFTTETSETDQEYYTKDSKDEKTLTVSLNSTSEELPSENRVEALNEKIQRRKIEKIE